MSRAKQASPPEIINVIMASSPEEEPKEAPEKVTLELVGAGSFSGEQCAGRVYKRGQVYEMTEKEAGPLIATGLFSLKGSDAE